MALEHNDLLQLMKNVARVNPSSGLTAYSFDGKQFSYDALNEALRIEMNELAGTHSLYRENKNELFSLMEQTFDEILPARVKAAYGQFAEVKTFNQGDKPIFKLRTGKTRAKQFITKVGLAGVYEVFKLGEKVVEVPTTAVGGAAAIGLEEFLDGKVDFAELTQVIMDGMDELIYTMISDALVATISGLPAPNKASSNAFDATMFNRLIAIASSYGEPTIYCTEEFASTMKDGNADWYSDTAKDELRTNGYFAKYKTHNVIIMPQSMEDETNAVKQIDPKYCYIVPAGSSDGKPVKLAFEGQTIVDEYVNRDRSREVQVYKKVGAAAVVRNNVCVFTNTSLSKNTVA